MRISKNPFFSDKNGRIRPFYPALSLQWYLEDSEIKKSCYKLGLVHSSRRQRQFSDMILQAGTSTRIAPWRSTVPGTAKSRIPEAPKPFSHPGSGSTGDDNDDSSSGDSDPGKAPSSPSSLFSSSSRHCHIIELTVGCAQFGVCRNVRHGFEERWCVAYESKVLQSFLLSLAAGS